MSGYLRRGVPLRAQQSTNSIEGQTPQQYSYLNGQCGPASGIQRVAVRPHAPPSSSDLRSQAMTRPGRHLPNGNISSPQVEPMRKGDMVRRSQVGQHPGGFASEPLHVSNSYNTGSTTESSRRHNKAAIDPSNRGLWDWIPTLHKPDDDAAIIDNVMSLLSRADEFVDMFYQNRPYAGGVSLEVLSKTNSSPMIATDMLDNHLQQANVQITIIKHALITRLLDLISFDDHTRTESLLPEEFRGYHILARAKTNNTSELTGNIHIQPALSAHRVLCAHIRHSMNGNNDDFSLAQQTLVDRVLRVFDEAFSHWKKQEKSGREWLARFSELLTMTRALGTRLFSQPAVYLFDWEVNSEDCSRQTIPTWPRLLKVVDTSGRQLKVPECMIEMQFGSIFTQVPARSQADARAEPPRDMVAREIANGKHGRLSRDPRIMKDLPVVPAYEDSKDENQRLQPSSRQDFFPVTSIRSNDRKDEQSLTTTPGDAMRYGPTGRSERARIEHDIGTGNLQASNERRLRIAPSHRAGHSLSYEPTYAPEAFSTRDPKRLTGNINAVWPPPHTREGSAGRVQSRREIDHAYLFDTNILHDYPAQELPSAHAASMEHIPITGSHRRHQSQIVPQGVTTRDSSHAQQSATERPSAPLALKSNLPAQYLYYPKAGMHTKSASLPNVEGVAREQRHFRQISSLPPPPAPLTSKSPMGITAAQSANIAPRHAEGARHLGGTITDTATQKGPKAGRGKLRKRSPSAGRAAETAQYRDNPY